MTVTGSTNDSSPFEHIAPDDDAAAIADTHAAPEEDSTDGVVILGDSAHIVVDDETGEVRLLVLVADDEGLNVEVHVPLDDQAIDELTAGVRDARDIRLAGRSVEFETDDPYFVRRLSDLVDEDEPRPWASWTAGRRGVDPAGLTGLGPSAAAAVLCVIVVVLVLVKIFF
ncbi:hypothetical protein [Nocardia sp. NPDC052566]|uniref:hypothetical protein n=1 Tax=Nocardia sp. NPDC052566 TaxID=3364330 RepID=UPI0037C51968